MQLQTSLPLPSTVTTSALLMSLAIKRTTPNFARNGRLLHICSSSLAHPRKPDLPYTLRMAISNGVNGTNGVNGHSQTHSNQFSTQSASYALPQSHRDMLDRSLKETDSEVAEIMVRFELNNCAGLETDHAVSEK